MTQETSELQYVVNHAICIFSTLLVLLLSILGIVFSEYLSLDDISIIVLAIITVLFGSYAAISTIQLYSWSNGK